MNEPTVTIVLPLARAVRLRGMLRKHHDACISDACRGDHKIRRRDARSAAVEAGDLMRVVQEAIDRAEGRESA